MRKKRVVGMTKYLSRSDMKLTTKNECGDNRYAL